MAAGRFVISWAVIGFLEFPGRVNPLVLNADGSKSHDLTGENHIHGVHDIAVAVVGQLAVGPLGGTGGDGELSINQ